MLKVIVLCLEINIALVQYLISVRSLSIKKLVTLMKTSYFSKSTRPFSLLPSQSKPSVDFVSVPNYMLCILIFFMKSMYC